MENVWGLASLWVGLALVATLLGIWLKISTALTEIVVGTVAQLVIGAFLIQGGLGAKTNWISFVAGTGAIVLTFLAGAELDPVIFRMKWKEATVVGLVGFFGPFVGCTAIAHFILGWPPRPSWLAGVALSITSVAVVYAVMLELGFNTTEFGKAILAACFINDLKNGHRSGSHLFSVYVSNAGVCRHFAFKYERNEGLYYTWMMSTGLTFGTISALFGLNHRIIHQAQYSFLVATVIGSALVPTMIANSFLMPKHLLSRLVEQDVPASTPQPSSTPAD
jgi:Kef-type K+ transport system membrane component KefB